MSSKLSMQDIIDLLVAKNDIGKEEAEAFFVQFFSIIEKGLSTDELVKVKDFGSFKLTHIQERESVDVNTQDKIVIPAHRRVSFLPAPLLKDMVNKPFAHFETTPLNEGIFMDGVSESVESDNDDEELDAEENEGEENEDTTASVESIKEEPIKKEPTIKDESAVTDIEESTTEETNIEIKNDNLSSPIAPLAPTVENNFQESILAQDETVSEVQENNSPHFNEVSKENEHIEAVPTDSVLNKSRTKKPKSKGKLRRYILRWDIAIALFMILTISFAYNYYFRKHNPCEKGIEKSEIPKTLKELAPTSIGTSSNEPAVVADSVETEKTMEPTIMVKMSPGRTLRLIALDKLGNRDFWVYIYMKNKDKIPNPDVIPIGLELELPYKDEYPMDAANPDHVAKGKALGDTVMKDLG